jgi:hypothetical protein
MPALASTPVYESFFVDKKFSLTLVSARFQALTKFVFGLPVTDDLSAQVFVV